MDNPRGLDPDVIRTRIRDAIRQMAPDSQMEAFKAVQRGEVELSLGPFEQEIWVQVGDVTVILDLADCAAEGDDERRSG